MNNRHQFRGKRLGNGEWVTGGSVVQFLDDGLRTVYMPSQAERCVATHDARDNIVGFENCVFYKVDPATVGQCTGLKDKNGRFIFEGDILKVEAGIYYGSDYVGEIRFDGRAFMWFTVPSLLERHFNPANGTQDGIDSGDCEIIGNIHDNPELLSKEAP